MRQKPKSEPNTKRNILNSQRTLQTMITILCYFSKEKIVHTNVYAMIIYHITSFRC